MRRPFEDYKTIVKFLVQNQGKSLDEAIREANVPERYDPIIRANFSDAIEISKPSIISGKQQGITLLSRTELSGCYLSGLESFLADPQGRSREPEAVLNILSSAKELISKIPDPYKNHAFAYRGMVVGHIQSGKTANMAALIAAAADNKYNFVIVLAGLYNDLRAQTQRRLDQEVTGCSDQTSDYPLVEHAHEALSWKRLTKSGIDGDFRTGPTDRTLQNPKLAVIKKNVKVLERFIKWLDQLPFDLADFPALIIDDEADQASVNTNYGKLDDEGEPIDPTKTNQAIRDLLSKFPKHTYIGYTATPFASFLIDKNENDDLFPRDFIAVLSPPSDYFGPRQLFGLGMSSSENSPNIPETPDLDVIREITPQEKNDMKLTSLGDDCPRVIEDALISFVLGCCARIDRKQGDRHFSMFIHPSHATDRQEVFFDIVTRQLQLLRAAATWPKALPDIINKAREMWESDFQPTINAYGEFASSTFEEIWQYASEVIETIETIRVNYRSEDSLNYDSWNPKRYVVVGGNRLSRGLTIEGLMVSVFLRDTNFYDTLLQMGRWFGYRPNYVDLTRIYVEDDVAEKFSDLARVELELREDLEKYSQEPDPPTPAELVPRIRSHPIMLVTAPNKHGAGTLDVVPLAGRTRETVSFPLDRRNLLSINLQIGRSTISGLGIPTLNSKDGSYYWKNQDVATVLDLVSKYAFSTAAPIVNKKIIRNYIQQMKDKGELIFWDIVLPSGNPNLAEFEWCQNIRTKKVNRGPKTQKSIGVLSSPGDLKRWRIALDRDTNDPTTGALFLYIIDNLSKSKSGKALFSNPQSAEDVLGLVFVFPNTNSYTPVTYISQ
ncbi:MAG: Z1 domain-containing protein [Oligoflexus sp.]